MGDHALNVSNLEREVVQVGRQRGRKAVSKVPQLGSGLDPVGNVHPLQPLDLVEINHVLVSPAGHGIRIAVVVAHVRREHDVGEGHGELDFAAGGADNLGHVEVSAAVLHADDEGLALRHVRDQEVLRVG